MEIVLGIDNIVFIAIVTSRLPTRAPRISLTLTLVVHILLLQTLSQILKLQSALFHRSSLGLPCKSFNEKIDEVSGKDSILFAGGLFLIWKSVHEIHKNVHDLEDDPQEHVDENTNVYGTARPSDPYSLERSLFRSTLVQIAGRSHHNSLSAHDLQEIIVVPGGAESFVLHAYLLGLIVFQKAEGSAS